MSLPRPRRAGGLMALLAWPTHALASDFGGLARAMLVAAAVLFLVVFVVTWIQTARLRHAWLRHLLWAFVVAVFWAPAAPHEDFWWPVWLSVLVAPSVPWTTWAWFGAILVSAWLVFFLWDGIPGDEVVQGRDAD